MRAVETFTLAERQNHPAGRATHGRSDQDDPILRLQPQESELTLLTQGMKLDGEPAFTAPAEPGTAVADPAESVAVNAAASDDVPVSVGDDAEKAVTGELKEEGVVAAPASETAGKSESALVAAPAEKPAEPVAEVPKTVVEQLIEQAEKKAAEEPATTEPRRGGETVTVAPQPVIEAAVEAAAEKTRTAGSAGNTSPQTDSSGNDINTPYGGVSHAAFENVFPAQVTALYSRMTSANLYGIQFKDPEGQKRMLGKLLDECRWLHRVCLQTYSGGNIPGPVTHYLAALGTVERRIAHSIESLGTGRSQESTRLSGTRQGQSPFALGGVSAPSGNQQQGGGFMGFGGGGAQSQSGGARR